MKMFNRESLYLFATMYGVKIQWQDRIPFFGMSRLRERILNAVSGADYITTIRAVEWMVKP